MVKDERSEKIENNLALVHSLARRFINRGVEYDDLYQAGCLGLIKAADGFDESRGFQFSTYAVPVIMGEIRRLFRDGGAIKISRSLKEKSVSVQRLREAYINENGTEPTVSELSELCGINAEELSEILNISSPVISLSTDESEIDIPYDESERNFDRLSLEIASSKLGEREQKLIKYRYFEGKTQVECAKLLGISQVQVSRLEKSTLKRLKELLI